MDLDSGCGAGLDSSLRSSGARSGGLGFELGRDRCVPIRYGVFHRGVFDSVAVIILVAGDSGVIAAVHIWCLVAVAYLVLESAAMDLVTRYTVVDLGVVPAAES